MDAPGRKAFLYITLYKEVEKGHDRLVASQTKHSSLTTSKAHTANEESD